MDYLNLFAYIQVRILQAPIYKGVQYSCTVNALFHPLEIVALHRPELGTRLRVKFLVLSRFRFSPPSKMYLPGITCTNSEFASKRVLVHKTAPSWPGVHHCHTWNRTSTRKYCRLSGGTHKRLPLVLTKNIRSICNLI